MRYRHSRHAAHGDGTDIPAEPSCVRRAAMNLLARREYGSGELASRLLRRFGNASAPIIEAELTRLDDAGLLSDQRAMEQLVHTRLNRGFGPLRIGADLRQRGFDEAAVRATLAELDKTVDWSDLANAVIAKRLGADTGAGNGEPAPPPADRHRRAAGQAEQQAKEKARLARFLAGRGFAFEHFSHLLR